MKSLRRALTLFVLAAGIAVSSPVSAAPARGNCGCAAGDLMCAMRCSAG